MNRCKRTKTTCRWFKCRVLTCGRSSAITKTWWTNLKLSQTTISIRLLTQFSFQTLREKSKQPKFSIEIQICSIMKMRSSLSFKSLLESLLSMLELKLLKNTKLKISKSIRRSISKSKRLSLWKLRVLRKTELENLMRLIEETHK